MTDPKTSNDDSLHPWFAEARFVESLEADIGFTLQPHFYYGPDRPDGPSDLQRFVVPLSPPDIPRAAESVVRTAEAVGHEAQLAAYYAQIIRLAREHGRPFESIRHHFWLRFRLWNDAHAVHVSFPWYDHFIEIDRLIRAIVEIESGLVDHDQDQGWEMEIHSHGGALFIRERDPDADETYLAVVTPRAALVTQLTDLRDRTRGVIGRLSGELGTDLWTRQPPYPGAS